MLLGMDTEFSFRFAFSYRQLPLKNMSSGQRGSYPGTYDTTCAQYLDCQSTFCSISSFAPYNNSLKNAVSISELILMKYFKSFPFIELLFACQQKGSHPTLKTISSWFRNSQSLWFSSLVMSFVLNHTKSNHFLVLDSSQIPNLFKTLTLLEFIWQLQPFDQL